MITEQVRSPISADAPGGRDVRYDDEFDALKNEIGKQSAVGSRTDFDRLVQRGSQLVGGKAGGDGVGTLTEDAGGPDYARIVELATNILSTKSKDLQVAGYLCLGLFRSERYAGLAEGLEIYKALLDGFWDTLYPELRRMEGRRQAVQWIAQRIGDLVPALPPEPGEREDVDKAIATGKAIDALLRERVEESPPSLSALTRALSEALDVLPAPRAAVEEPSGGGAAAIPVTVVTAASAELKTEDDADLAVARAADFLRGAQPKWPVGYRLMRSLRWDAIEALPPNEGGRTSLGAPPDDYRSRLQMAQSGGSPADALAACEEIFYEAPNHFWLDLQRIADQAVGAMGTEYAGLRRLLRHEVARLIERLPGIETLSFGDGTPFADGATREWIDREVRPLSSAAPAASPAAAGPEDAALKAQLDEAQALAGNGDLAGALDMLQNAQASDARRRPRFLRQLAMARLCLSHGKPAAARPLLEGLDEMCDRYGLPDWEPELCVQVWKLLRRCYESLAPDALPQAKEDYEKRMDRCFDKICRIDVRLAVAEGGGA
jgi:type VI secretion system protein VasJ